MFKVNIDNCRKEDIPLYRELYKNVKSKKLGLNTFDLPLNFFEHLCESKNWEVISIESTEEKRTVCVVFCAKTENNYCPIVIGLDYSIDESFNVYKKSLYQIVKRGLELKADKICLGLSASDAKHKLGAETIKKVAYIQMKDNYNMTLIESIRLNVN